MIYCIHKNIQSINYNETINYFKELNDFIYFLWKKNQVVISILNVLY